MLARLRRVAAEEGLPLGERTVTYNSRRAQELGKWAEERDKGEEFHRAMFHAYFAEGSNIALIEELLRVVAAAGLPQEETRTVLEERTYRAAVDQDWALARRWGITAVPTFVLNGQALVGAQPYEMMERLVESQGVGRKA